MNTQHVRSTSGRLSVARLMSLITLGFMVSGCAVISGSDAGSGEIELQRITTDDGHSYAYYAMPNASRSAVSITWKSDLPDVATMHEATALLAVDLMQNGGAGGRAPEDIFADFEDLDAGAQLWVQPREVTGFVVAPEEHMGRAAIIANEVLVSPNLEERWFKRQKKLFIDNAKEWQQRVDGQAWLLIRDILLGDHPYRRFWSQVPATGIDSIQLNDVERWHQQTMVVSDMAITAAGSSSPDVLSAHIDTVLKNMPRGEATPPIEFSGPAVLGKTIVLHQPDAAVSMIVVVGNLDKQSGERTVEANLGIGVLGLGKQSRLFKTVRTGLRAAYGFSANRFQMPRGYELIEISGEVETAKINEALAGVASTYEEFRLNGIGRLEYPIAQRFYKRKLAEEFRKPESVAWLLMQGELYENGVNTIPMLQSSIDLVDRQAANAAIKEMLPPFDNMLKVIVSPDANAVPGACVITQIEQWEQC